MNIEEKLQHFMDASMLCADQKYKKIVDDYKLKLDQAFEDHKTEATRKSQIQEKAAVEAIHRDFRKQQAKEQMNLKREISLKLDELKKQLFEEVSTMLESYKQTPAYYALLLSQIQDAKSVAHGEDIKIYIDPKDASYLERLEADSQSHLTISEYSFMGGIRAVISSRNILIDNSFQSKLEDAGAHFHIEY